MPKFPPARASTSEEHQLREKIENGSQNPDDYSALAAILSVTGRCEESIETLRNSLNLPLPDLSRSDLLTLLGWYVNILAGDLEEAVSLGEQAAALTQGAETPEALAARALAQHLVAHSVWNVDRTRATKAATSASLLFARVTDTRGTFDDLVWYDIHSQAARVNGLLGRAEEAEKLCKQALQLAPNQDQRIICMAELGAIYRIAGRLIDSRQTLAKTIKTTSSTPGMLVRPFHELGLTERALGKLPEARAKQYKALDLHQDAPSRPGYVPAITREIAEISYELGDFAGAAKAYRTLVDLYALCDPMYWAWLDWLARCQLELGQFEVARTNLERIVESSFAPDDKREHARRNLLHARAATAQAHYESKDYTSCITECESLLRQIGEDDEWHSVLLLLLGHSYAVTRKHSQARKYYKAIIDCPWASRPQAAMARECLARLARIV